jgi:endonuclease/exonuclease/phosphatase family metal-dependent hydrolase
VDCNDIHQVKTGDRLSGLSGVVVYNFDQFKIVLDSTLPVTVEPTELAPLLIMPQLGAEQISIVTINAEDYFDTNRDTADDGEPVLTDEELSTRQVKLTHVLTNLLACPTIIGFQEIEKASLLDALADELAGSCGFAYEVSHLESADSRGIDNALLSDASRVSVQSVALRQACSPVPTGIEDESIACESGQEPLFGRPPLQVEVTIDGKPFTFFINHFKSKRGGEIETELERIQQAVYLNELAAEILTSDANANIIALGDLNDTELSPVMLLLTDPGQGGNFVNILSAVPRSQRYTYNFGGVSELLDVILLSPSLAVEANASFILHVNTDYPVAWRLDAMPERITYRFSDHDIPVLILGEASPTPAPTIPASPKPHPQSIPSPAPTVSPATVPAPTVTPLPASADNRTESSAASATGRSPAMNVAMLLAVGTVFLAVLGLVWYRRDR